jgi:hypothetical protein
VTGCLGMSDIIDCGDNFSPWGHNTKLPALNILNWKLIMTLGGLEAIIWDYI